MAGYKYSYSDLSHPTFQDTLKSHNYSTLKLVKTVAEFAQKISLAHEQFANQVLNVVEQFKKRNLEIRIERPSECPSSLDNVWEKLLQETQYDAQNHADTATLIMKNVYTPLLEITSYKRSQSKRLYLFRENFEGILQNGEEQVYQCHKAYVQSYQNYRLNLNSRDSSSSLADYHNAHNAYVLQIRASNQQEEEYHQLILPTLLEELEDIHIDLANTLNGAIESHALLLLTKASEQSRKFENILRLCKLVNPKMDIHNFILSISPNPADFEARQYSFQPPSDPNIPGSEISEILLGTLKEHVIIDRNTETVIKAKRHELQREAAELTSYLKQNQDVTKTLVNVCQRNLANHLYAKVYETQEDLCRKRNEIRTANLQLAAIRAQIDLISPKQNGSAIEVETGSKTQQKATIKGMWKKAFKSLKTKDREKERDKDSMREGQEKEDMQEKDKQDTPYSKKISRQSSLKNILRRKDSRESTVTMPSEPQENLPTNPEDDAEIDPVYSLLKCAADLPRHSSYGKFSQGHACCMRSSNLTNEIPSIRSNSRSNSRSSSPSSTAARTSTARERRVRFMQETKSQSLDIPYHHIHEQHKMNVVVDGEPINERSSSFTAITHCHNGEKGNAQARQGFLQYQRSLSVDEAISPGDSGQDKSESGVKMENITKGTHFSQELWEKRSCVSIYHVTPHDVAFDLDLLLHHSNTNVPHHGSTLRLGNLNDRGESSNLSNSPSSPQLRTATNQSSKNHNCENTSPRDKQAGPADIILEVSTVEEKSGERSRSHQAHDIFQDYDRSLRHVSPRSSPRSLSLSPHHGERRKLVIERQMHAMEGDEVNPNRLQNFRPGPDNDKRNSPTQGTRRQKLNVRMKSFSLDAPEPPTNSNTPIDETVKRKSNSSNSCYGESIQGPVTIQRNHTANAAAYQRRARFWNRSTSLDTDEYMRRDTSAQTFNSPQANSPKQVRRLLPSNLYVVLYNFRGRERDDLELRAGWRLSAIDTSDPDWWKGRCNGKVGYFPARYVERLNPAEKVMQVTQGLEISEGDNGIKLLKDQIVIQESRDSQGMALIRTGACDRFPCPLKYLQYI